MLKTRNYLLDLVERYRDNNCSRKEVEQLRQYLEDKRYQGLLEELFIEVLLDEAGSKDSKNDPHMKEELANLYLRILNQKNIKQLPSSEPRGRFRPPIGRWMVAASILILGTMGTLWYLAVQQRNTLTSKYGDDVQQADERPLLTLADGRIVPLNENKGGIVLSGSGITYADGANVLGTDQAIIRPATQVSDPDAATERLVLTTPKGRQFQVTLPDQTIVWLNASTTLRYPAQFGSDQRVVDLDGEAYFDVKPAFRRNSELESASSTGSENSIPFIVKTAQQTIQVLGTEFNVLAYPDEPAEQLTLVEGSVRVTRSRSSRVQAGGSEQAGFASEGILLTPGDQIIVAENDVKVCQADVNAVTSWRRGRFSFDDKTFQQVMAELARWYDIEIVYEGAIPDVKFFGDAIRTTNLSTLLYLIESTKVSYRIEGRKLIIAPNQSH